MRSIYHHHHHHRFHVRESMLARVRRFPLNKPLHISRSLAHSALYPYIFMSPFTHSLQDFFPLPRNLDPTTAIDLQADTQSGAFLRSRCPNHLSLPLLNTTPTSSKPNRLYSSMLAILSLRVTPHIHLTIIRSALSSLLTSSTLTAQVSLPYIRTLCTQSR